MLAQERTNINKGIVLKIFLKVSVNYNTQTVRRKDLVFLEILDDSCCLVTNNYIEGDLESIEFIARLNHRVFIQRLKYTKEYFITKVLLLQTEFEFLKKVGLL